MPEPRLYKQKPRSKINVTQTAQKPQNRGVANSIEGGDATLMEEETRVSQKNSRRGPHQI
jgi:hypothetical protein